MIKGRFVATIQIDIAVDENTLNLLPFEKLKGAVHNDMEVVVNDMLCEELGDIATVKVTKTFADLYRTEDKLRLIDADAMRDDWLKNGENEYVYDTNAVLDSIDSQPTVDAVEVVRCRDCKFGGWDSEPDDAIVCMRTKDGFWRSGNDFCSFGKRKDGAD